MPCEKTCFGLDKRTYSSQGRIYRNSLKGGGGGGGVWARILRRGGGGRVQVRGNFHIGLLTSKKKKPTSEGGGGALDPLMAPSRPKCNRNVSSFVSCKVPPPPRYRPICSAATDPTHTHTCLWGRSMQRRKERFFRSMTMNDLCSRTRRAYKVGRSHSAVSRILLVGGGADRIGPRGGGQASPPPPMECQGSLTNWGLTYFGEGGLSQGPPPPPGYGPVGRSIRAKMFVIRAWTVQDQSARWDASHVTYLGHSP